MVDMSGKIIFFSVLPCYQVDAMSFYVECPVTKAGDSSLCTKQNTQQLLFYDHSFLHIKSLSS